MDINNFTKEELEEALRKIETKKSILKEALRDTKPEIVDVPDYTSLRKICGAHISFLANGKVNDANTLEHYIFEAAMETLYGADVFDWINRQTINFSE